MPKLLPLEFRMYRRLSEAPFSLQGKSILVACSGGRDSVALASCLHEVSRKLGFKIVLIHVHHGPSENPEVAIARRKASARVRSFAKDLGVRAIFPRPKKMADGKELRSEEELRQYRHSVIRSALEKGKMFASAFAHHADDLLETRLIRLIRGTGPAGLEAMVEWKVGLMRPFLSERGTEIGAYAKQKKLQWVEDPTNLSDEPLRNWIRLTWLPLLEQKRVGASRAIARSLDSIVASYRDSSRNSLERAQSSDTIDREKFASLGVSDAKSQLATFLRERGVMSFSSQQIEEILKRLGSNRRTGKQWSFELLGFEWRVNAKHITVLPRQTGKK